VVGNGTRHLGTLMERLYDLPLFVPLWLEGRIVNGNGKHANHEVEDLREVTP
jgi:hypothetical protein